MLMNPSFLPIALRSLAASALLLSSALAQTPAPDAATVPPAAQATPPPKPFSPMEKNFIRNAGKSIYYQIQLATAAKTAITDEKLTKIRDTTIRDLNKAWTALSKIAEERGETVASELSGSDKMGIERMGKMKPDKFTKEWLDELSKESKKLDREFESASKSLQDPEMKTFAANYSAIVRNVYTTSDAAEKSLKRR